jgi:hypothetical protein
LGTRNSEEWKDRYYLETNIVEISGRLDTIQTNKSSLVKQRLTADFTNASADIIIFNFSHYGKK